MLNKRPDLYRLIEKNTKKLWVDSEESHATQQYIFTIQLFNYFLSQVREVFIILSSEKAWTNQERGESRL